MTSSKARPTSIRIFLADGTPEGIRIVEKSNWTGRAVVASRAQLTEVLHRDELVRPGVYVLVGPGETGTSHIYVGEADVLRDRLKQHAKQKDFWTRFVAFTSTDENLNKAHVRYLESRLVTLAKSANQWEIENHAIPAEPPLSSALYRRWKEENPETEIKSYNNFRTIFFRGDAAVKELNYNWPQPYDEPEEE